MDTTALYKISYGVYVIGTKIDGKDAGCVVDAFIQSTVAPVPTVILCSILANQTNEAIKQTGEFTVSVLGAKVDPFVVGNFGLQSGRNADKWGNVPHTYHNGLPVLEGAIAYCCCKVTDAKELGTHTAFFAEVTDAWQGAVGEPLLYGEYQKTMKPLTQASFNAFKEGGEIKPQGPKWVCKVCGYVYDGEIPFEDLPDDYTCPLCGAPKSEFEQQ